MNNSLWKNCKEVFSIDLRALAFFRMGLGALLLFDLLKRSRALEAHYTDSGVLPRHAMEKFLVPSFPSSFHTLSGSFEVQAFLFLLAGFFALCLLLGFQTRLMTILSLILLSSLQRRNLLIEHTGDDLLRMLVFWSMFLPLGALYSLDHIFRKNDTPQPHQVFSVATVAFITQYILIYFSTGFFKWQHEVWRQGYAIFVTLNIDTYATRLGHFLIDQHTFLTFLTYATFFIEGILPLFLLIPWGLKILRPLILLILLCFHLGIWMMLEVGLFQVTILCGLICFLPGSFWEQLFKYTKIDRKLNQWQLFLRN